MAARDTLLSSDVGLKSPSPKAGAGPPAFERAWARGTRKASKATAPFGPAATNLLAVVTHYDQQFNLNLTPAQKADLVEFLKSL
jgi:hypothetical protein